MGRAASNFLVPSAHSQLKSFANFQKFSKTQILAFLFRFNCKQYIKGLKDWDIIYNLVLTMLLIWRKLVQRLLGFNFVAFFGEPPYLSMRSQKFNVLIKDPERNSQHKCQVVSHHSSQLFCSPFVPLHLILKGMALIRYLCILLIRVQLLYLSLRCVANVTNPPFLHDMAW